MRHKFLFITVILTCFISLSFTLFTGSAFAKMPIGKLSAFMGEVELEREGKPIPLRLNLPIVAKDRIKVEEGIAEIKYDDGSIVKIWPRTELTLDQRPVKRKILGLWSKTSIRRLINISKGKVSGIIKERKDLVTEFETPTLVTIAKGTTLDIVHNPVTGETEVHLDVGVVDSYTLDGWTVMTLETGDRVAVRIDPVTGAASIHSYSGTISVRAGDTTSTIDPGDTMTANVDPTTGESSIRAEKGSIDVKVGDATVILDQGEAISGKVDATTGEATVVATKGEVTVTAQGQTVTVSEGQSTTVARGAAPTTPTVPPAPTAPPALPPAPPPAPPEGGAPASPAG